MNRLFFTAIAVAAIWSAALPQLSAQTHKPMNNYQKEWQAIQKLSHNDQPKKMQSRIDSLHRRAMDDGNYEQVLKALVYRLNVTGELADSDSAAAQLIGHIKTDIRQLPQPARAVAYSMLGELYQTFYDQNRYTLEERTYTPTASDDLLTWDARRTIEAMVDAYEQSLQPIELLQQTPAVNYSELFSNTFACQKDNLQPSLYDVLARRALNAYAADRYYHILPQTAFVVNRPEYFADAPTFAALDLTAGDPHSLQWLSLRIYRDLLRFHLAAGRAHATALVDADLQRIHFLDRYGRTHNPAHRLDSMLMRLDRQYSPYPANARVLFELAEQCLATDPERAYELCQRIRRNYPAELPEQTDAMMRQISRTTLAVSFYESEQPSGTPFLVRIGGSNLPSVIRYVYRLTDQEANRYRNFISQPHRNREKAFKELIGTFSKPTATKIDLPRPERFRSFTTEIGMEPLSRGQYFILFCPGNDPTAAPNNEIYDARLLCVTDLMAFDRTVNGQLSFTVTDRASGTPVEGAVITVETKENEFVKLRTDRDGQASMPAGEYYRTLPYTVTDGNDRLVVAANIYHNYRREEQPPLVEAKILTDRAIYRPGQKVYYKVILYRREERTPKLVTHHPTEITLRDANGTVLHTHPLTTNEYGSADGVFELPVGLLNGTARLGCEYSQQSIRIEEYKRPTFEVSFRDVEGSYRPGDTVSVTAQARALAGYAIDGANVKYRVVRQTMYRTWRYGFDPMSEPEREIASGDLKSDERGLVEVSFVAVADDVKDPKAIHTYVVTVDVTDSNGETQSADTHMQVSALPMRIVTQLPAELPVADTLRRKLRVTNLDGVDMPATVRVEITALTTPDRVLRHRPDRHLPAMMNTIAESDFRRLFPYDAYGDELRPDHLPERNRVAAYTLDTRTPAELDLTALTQPGYYRIKLVADNGAGLVLEETHYVYQPGNRPGRIFAMNHWIKPVKLSGEPGETAEWWIGGAMPESHVYYEIIADDKIVEKGWLKTGPTAISHRIPIREAWRGGGFSVQYLMVQQNRCYHKEYHVSVPATNRLLKIELATFRDKLQPGQRETWSMTVSDAATGARTAAEVAASLYDASLDQFTNHYWPSIYSFYPYVYRQLSFNWYQRTLHTYPYQMQASGFSWYTSTSYADINWRGREYAEGLELGGRSRLYYAHGQRISAELYNMGDAMVVESAGINRKAEIMMETSGDAAMKIAAPTASSDPPKRIAVRTNFNETAFFYPALRTNEQGEVQLTFTMPESLTRWRLLSFAHTPDLRGGSYTNQLVTQKQVAITANPPRFFREHDTIEFTAKVNSVESATLKGHARLQLFDAVTMQPIDDSLLQSAAEQPFSVEGGQSTGLRWRLAIPVGLQAVVYRVTAQAGTHTDGEEKIVPVMTNSMLVTETMPFSIRAGQQRALTFDRLTNYASTTLRHHSLTLEFTSAPAWYAVQSLPYLMEYPYECAEQLFARYYANTLATSLIQRMPRIREVFRTWQTLGSEALVSNLEKNQELKQVMLEETPWVMQAKNDTERKRRVGLLFDLNRMSDELGRALEKLKRVRNSDGGFPWFKGLLSNRYITQHIVAGLSHLQQLGALPSTDNDAATDFITQGLPFLDGELRDDYDQLLRDKVNLKTYRVGSTQLHHLYAYSFRRYKPTDRSKCQAFDYFLKQTAENWKPFGTYERAMAALVLHRYGMSKPAQAILTSLREHAQQSDEMGMYWKDNVAGYYWHQAPIETQAMLIEAFHEVAADTVAVEEMKIWLLRNKQTNDWKTTKATTEAIYALLMTGSNLLDESQLLDVSIGGKPLAEAAAEPLKPEAGTGYVKTAWPAAAVDRSMGVLNVSNPNRHGIAWGGLYWQYFEQLDKITAAETKLRMNKQLFLRVITPNGEELRPITEANRLKVGDLVRVRMELRADRDYEYVHLKDMRASGFEPVSTLSGHRYQDRLSYYESIKDASTNFFIHALPKGTYVFEYDLRVAHAGRFSNGITTFQCMYAPEFSAHSEGIRVHIE